MLDPKKRLLGLQKYAQKQEKGCQRKINSLAFARFVLFIGAIVSFGLGFSGDKSPTFLVFGIGCSLSFLILMKCHDKLYQLQERYGRITKLCTYHLDILDLKLNKIDSNPTFEESHPFAHDCDFAGQFGLWKMLDHCRHEDSSKHLKSCLLNSDLVQIKQRQARVKAWSKVPLQNFKFFLSLSGSESWQPSEIKKSFQYVLPFTKSGWVSWLLAGFGVFNLVIIGLVVFQIKTNLPWKSIAFLQFILYLWTNSQHKMKLWNLLRGANQLQALQHTLEALGQCQPASKRAKAQSMLGATFLGKFKTFNQSLDRLRQRQNALPHFLLNYGFQWDALIISRLPKLNAEFSLSIENHMNFCLEEEAYASLGITATHHPNWSWPIFHESSYPELRAKQIGHPLLGNNAVTNDFELDGKGQVILITGSNMSGKSTFLRSLGVNYAFAKLGLPVFAEEFKCSVMNLVTSMRIRDDLENGISTFMAEVKKLRHVVAIMESSRVPVFFLLDEILHGTNSRERLIAVKKLTTFFTQNNSAGMITTHDLELLSLGDLFPQQIHLAHFRDVMQKDKMAFDYTLQEGPLSTTNALKILELQNFPLTFIE